jgi:recombinational DNA repair protein (RecF pathway)
MKCDVCGVELQEGQVYTYQGKTVCEDCCFDLMSTTKICDPTAVSSSLNVRKELGQSGTEGLTELQKQIYTTVVERGKVNRAEFIAEMHLTEEEFQKQFAILRHCELLRAFKEGNAVYLAKFGT